MFHCVTKTCHVKSENNLGSMSILWTEKVLYDKMLLYVTDAVSYIMKSRHVHIFPKLVNFTCMVHGLHKKIRSY